MHQQPYQPADQTTESNSADIHNGAKARDRGRRPQVVVTKGALLSVTPDAAKDRRCRVMTGLHGDLRYARKAIKTHQVADHEDLWVTGNGEVGQHRYAPSSINRRIALSRKDGSER